MNILVKVDQAECMRRGINAPQSTVQLDVDPAKLSQAQREALADVLVDGYDTTQHGMATNGEDTDTDPLAIVLPANLDALKTTLDRMIARSTQLRLSKGKV